MTGDKMGKKTKRSVSIDTFKREYLTVNPNDPENPSNWLYQDDYDGSPALVDLEWKCYAIVQSVRLQVALNIPDIKDKTKPAYENTSLVDYALFKDFSNLILRMDSFIKEAREIGLIDDAFNDYIRKSKACYKLCLVPYHSGDETITSYGLKFFNAVAIIAMQGVKNWIRGEIVSDGNLFNLWLNISNYAPPACLKMSKEMAQKALNLLDDWWIVYSYQDKLLKQAVALISLNTNRLTSHPIGEPPEINDPLELTDYPSTKARQISLLFKHRLLGEPTDFLFSPEARDATRDEGRVSHKRYIGFEDLHETLLTAYEITKKFEWRELIENLLVIRELDPFITKVWASRLEDFMQLEFSVRWYADYIHAIGFMETENNDQRKEQEAQLGIFLHLTEEVYKWACSENTWEWIKKQVDGRSREHIITESGENIVTESGESDDDYGEFLSGEGFTDDDDESVEVTPVEIEMLATHLENTFNTNGEGIKVSHICDFLGRKQTQNHGNTLRKLIGNSYKEKRVYKGRGKSRKVFDKKHPVWVKLVKKFPYSVRTDVNGFWELKSGRQQGASGIKIAEWLMDFFAQESLDKIQSLQRTNRLIAEPPPKAPSDVQVKVLS